MSAKTSPRAQADIDDAAAADAAPARATRAAPAKAPGGILRRTQAERTALSDKRMFEVAVKLIGERGVQRTTLKEVCELAGYSRGLANYRFGSKDAFIREMIGQFNLAWEEHIRSVVGEKTGHEAVIAALDALEIFLVQHADSMRGMYMIWYGSLGDSREIQDRLAENHNAYRRDVQRWVSDGILQGNINASIDAENFAVHYCSFVLGTIYQWVVNPAAFDLHTIFSYYKTMTKLLLAVDPQVAIAAAPEVIAYRKRRKTGDGR